MMMLSLLTGIAKRSSRSHLVPTKSWEIPVAEGGKVAQGFRVPRPYVVDRWGILALVVHEAPDGSEAQCFVKRA